MSAEVLNAIISAEPQYRQLVQLSKLDMNDVDFDVYSAAESRILAQLEREQGKVYSKVKTFNDLLFTNFAYLHDMFLPYFAHNVLGYENEDEINREAIPALIELHEMGMFVIAGHGNDCTKTYQQKPYVQALFPVEMWKKLKKELDRVDRIAAYHVVQCNDKSVIATSLSASDIIELRRGSDSEEFIQSVVVSQSKKDGNDAWVPFTVLNQAIMCGNNADFGEKLYMLAFVMRDFCSPKLANQVLMQALKNAGFKKRVIDPFQHVQVASSAVNPSVHPPRLMLTAGPHVQRPNTVHAPRLMLTAGPHVQRPDTAGPHVQRPDTVHVPHVQRHEAQQTPKVVVANRTITSTPAAVRNSQPFQRQTPDLSALLKALMTNSQPKQRQRASSRRKKTKSRMVKRRKSTRRR